MDTPQRVPIRADLFRVPLESAEAIQLLGSRCLKCGEVFLGKRSVCENCSAQQMESLALGRQGTLWSYTVVRHEPPAGFRGAGPFEPYGLGLVELPEGIRILSPLDGEVDLLRIGLQMELEVYPLYTNDQRQEVMAFKFKPI